MVAISLYSTSTAGHQFNYVTFKRCTRPYSGGKTGSAVYINQQATFNNCIFEYCTSQKGGAILIGANTTFNSCIFRNNQGVSGGAVFVGASDEGKTGVATFNNCTFQSNSINPASGQGGAIYIESNGNSGVVITGTTTISGNTAKTGGGGIYKLGPLTVSGTLKVTGNTSGGATNNVQFGSNTTMSIAAAGLLCGSSIGVTKTSATNIATGSADNCSNADRNHYFFSDPGTYHVATSTTSPFYNSSSGTLYLVANATYNSWHNSAAATGCTISGSYVTHINNAAGLAYFSKDVLTKDYSGQTVYLTADINLSGHNWEPIGYLNDCSDNSGKAFKGTFNGQGHTISNMTCPYQYDNMGLFGCVDGGTITNTFVVSGTLNASIADNIGGLVGWMKSGTITNSEAVVSMTGGTATVMGGLVGQMDAGTIHSSFAIPTFTNGGTVGGLVGKVSGGNVYNNFANASISSGTTKGGLVGYRTGGNMENCYVRGSSTLVGTSSTGTVNYCYNSGGSASGTNGVFSATQIPYTYKHQDNQITDGTNPYVTNGALDRNGLKGLLATLNKWVDGHSGYARWMRTSASPINDDYPIFDYAGYECVAANGAAIEYGTSFNTMFGKYITANSGNIYLYKSPSAAVTATLSNSGGVPALYIHEDVAMMHTSAVKAHVGITIDNTAGSNGADPSFGGSDAIDWHFFSSALADAPIGLVYGDESQYLAYHYPDWQAYFSDEDGYFPTNFNTSAPSAGDYYADWDLYAYFERCYHWINLKRNSASHWLEDWPGVNIPYENDVNFEPGRGYMVALKDEGYLQGYGTLNTNSGENDDFLYVPVTYTSEIAWTTREGHNLLGNPYQSYLDFNAFARDEENATLWNAGRTPFYIIIDEDKQNYVIYTVRQSKNTEQASRYLHPHQGFMVDVDKAGSARFCNAMRTTTLDGSWTGDFRDDSQPDYPLVNLMATDGYGNRDIVTVELGRPDKGGALKHDAWRTGKGSLWCRYEDEDYALVFTQPGLEYANIRFACDEDGEYTMTWNTQNGEFNYLHLIDNITGADIDCLSKSEYKFTAHASDYNSRFRLVFDYTGIEENGEDGPSTGSGTDTAFAFIMNGELVVNGTGLMQLIDLNGRMLTNYNINDAQSTVTLPDIPAGLYVLRLITENGTRTQKIILD